MDRLSFCQSMNIDPALQVKDFFNEVMGMYNLVENSEYRYISGSITENKNIIFTIGFDSISTTDFMRLNLSGRELTIYNTQFHVVEIPNESATELSLEFNRI